jgi:regulatory protein
MDNPYYEKLVNTALRFVSYRPRSEKEFTDFLSNKLARWKVSGSTLVKKVVERMRELGYVDDQAFTAWWINQRNEFRPKGRRVLIFELLRKGVKRGVIEDTIGSGMETPLNELESAQKAIQKKIVLWARMPIIEQKKKVYTFLTQRGFTSETIGNIIDELGKKD